MPSTTIQSRISAFESLATAPKSPPSAKHVSSSSPDRYTDILETPVSPVMAIPLKPVAIVTRPSPSPSPPNLGRKTSLIDLKDWVFDDGPVPLRNGFADSSKTPTQQVFASGQSTNGPPLISFESPPKPKPKPKPAGLTAALKTNPQLPPQLPPRKPSYTTLNPLASAPQPRRTDSLTAEHAHRYPPLAIDSDQRSQNGSTHAPSSSISSFHSVSLSEDYEPSTPGSVTSHIATFPMDALHSSPPPARRAGDSDSVSLSESYEEVSASSLASPNTERLINLAWDRAPVPRKAVPPRLPERPNSARPTTVRSPPPPAYPVARMNSGSGSSSNSPILRPTVSAASSSSSIVIPTPYVPRRAAPPPPSRSSDRSSIQSTTTTHSQSSSTHSYVSAQVPVLPILKTKRPTPVPLGVRRRYEAVFTANVVQRRRAERPDASVGEKPALLSPGEARGRRAVGWRGLSVDLITGDEMGGGPPPPGGDAVSEVVGPSEKLEGPIVRLIWRRSGLDKEMLAEIWNECDLTGQGALGVDAFVKGMWRIDEELRRAQASAIKSATRGSGGYRTQNVRAAPKLPSRPPRDILR
ncbi:hypothetical protein HYPSUDRAFT_63384 [Hypholoma sublateritium FD-334 SS-4]|uniref:EH domain-containing protein n=1 Tax=Hypholoma sublateritium (strain FD-334 SS-4) TaxID=945553 RepID=A0A0D2P813_HYPSF|nr:hypothetical protein HYPSUDRAFT_63384 [Hypholoma sublateritium FD-334 SS-4]